jgi:Holliday junction resolvase RusA-like endonuclease
MKLIAQYAKLAMGKHKPMQGAVIGIIGYYIPMPESWSRKKRETMLYERHTSKPDMTNLRKLVEDALTGIVYEDDCQIAYYEYEAKRWAITGSTEIQYLTKD